MKNFQNGLRMNLSVEAELAAARTYSTRVRRNDDSKNSFSPYQKRNFYGSETSQEKYVAFEVTKAL